MFICTPLIYWRPTSIFALLTVCPYPLLVIVLYVVQYILYWILSCCDVLYVHTGVHDSSTIYSELQVATKVLSGAQT